jgi:GNAT superfamily N-acetyltransferase
VCTTPPVDGYLNGMIDVRHAVPEDADELMRLRVIMLTGMTGAPPTAGPWQEAGVTILRRGLGPSLAAFVVDDVDRPGRLAACALGTIEQRLPNPQNASGRFGYVFNVATDPGCRRRGYSRACVQALLRWFDEHDVPAVDLKASPEGEPLYASLGFRHTTQPGMRRSSGHPLSVQDVGRAGDHQRGRHQ